LKFHIESKPTEIPLKQRAADFQNPVAHRADRRGLTLNRIATMKSLLNVLFIPVKRYPI